MTIAGLSSGRATDPLLAVRGLTVRFGDYAALRGVSLDLGAHAVHAIIGPNGAGKTTLFNAISGFAKPERGRVHLNGMDVTGLRADRLARLGLARSFQICSVFSELSVADNVRIALMRNLKILGMLRGGIDVMGKVEVDSLLEDVGLAAERNRRAVDLSYGRRRLLEIVTTLALKPKLLLLDEPTAGLAREDIPAVTALIARAAETCSVLLVEHNLPVVERLAAKVIVLAEGSVLCDGSYREVARDPRVIDVYVGARADA